jgi:arylsulfatase A-like enzyme
VRRAASILRATLLLLGACAPAGDTPSSDAPASGAPVAAPAPPARAGRPNLLLVSLDTTRADRLALYGGPNPTSPNLARLAQAGVTFTRAFAPGNESLYSHAALFTGRWPSEVAAPDYRSYGLPAGTPTLAGALAAYGYKTGAFTGGGHVVAPFGFDLGFETFRSVPVGTFGSLQDTVPSARAWMRAQGDSPWFAFVHGYDAHSPYQPPEPWPHLFTGQGSAAIERLVADPVAVEQVRGRRWYPGRTPRDFVHASGRSVLDPSLYTLPDAPRKDEPFEELSEDDIAHLRAHYDAALAYQDLWLGRLLAGVDLATTLVVVVADHGEDLLQHGFANHRAGLWDSTTRVPLVVAGPGFTGGARSDALVDLRDVVPTFLAAVEGKAPAGARGVPLQTIARGEAPAREAVFAEGVLDMASARGPTHRLVVRGLPLGEGSAERLANLPLTDASFDLYDVGRDPEELRDLLASPAAQDEALAERLRREMVTWRRSLASPDGAFQARVPAALEQGLRAQGYWTPDTP